MESDSGVAQYREYLRHLSYPEYAYRKATNTSSKNRSVLDLSLWNNKLPPGVLEATRRALPKTAGAYALAQDQTLLAFLAHKFGVTSNSLILTAGADDALRTAAHYSIRPGTRVLIPTPCFGRYAYHALIHEADITYLPSREYPYEFDPTKIIDAANKNQVECIFIASPNNPTGHVMARQAIQQVLDGVVCTVILDESLLLTIDDERETSLINQYPNLFICGSFSKLYGLSGLRIGYLVAHRTHTKQLRQLVSPFGVDALGIEIAKHVIKQRTWLRRRIVRINKGIAALRSIDIPHLRITQTQAPVALLDYSGQANLYQTLHDAGVLTVAGQEFPGLAESNAVRVIIRNEQDMLRLKRIMANVA